MPRPSPLQDTLQAAQAEFLPYGPPQQAIAIAAAVSYVGAEYAALRKHAAIFDQPQRATLLIRGADRHEFLGRMLTQNIKDFQPLTSRRSFWLNRKGRIEADLRLTELGDRLSVDLDAFSAARAVDSLTSFLFAEDVEIADGSESLHRLALHGPAAPAILAARASVTEGPPIANLADGCACQARVADMEVLIERQDSLAAPGFELTMAREAAGEVWRALAAPFDHDWQAGPSDLARPAGWHACNIARIEAGWPLYNVDFGPTNLPHETGVLRDRVSFTKGCYLGQEIVARMESLGKPKQVLVALKIEAPTPTPAGEAPPQPATGSRVLREAHDDAEVIGAVTSSAVSPMLGGVPICVAMVKQAAGAPGTRLFVEAEGRIVPATVQPTLRFWPQN